MFLFFVTFSFLYYIILCSIIYCLYTLYCFIILYSFILYYIIIIIILYYVMRFFRVLCASFASASVFRP